MDKAHLCKMTLYVRGAGMSLARIEVDTVALTYTRTYLHPDQLGSATAGTSQSGAVLWREQYAPYGDKLTAPAANDDLGSFTGHIDDDATTDMNLTYMQARYFDPGAGRFTSIDPVTFMDTGTPGMVNRYAYTLNDPVNNIDPDGRVCIPCGAALAYAGVEARRGVRKGIAGSLAASATTQIITDASISPTVLAVSTAKGAFVGAVQEVFESPKITSAAAGAAGFIDGAVTDLANGGDLYSAGASGLTVATADSAAALFGAIHGDEAGAAAAVAFSTAAQKVPGVANTLQEGAGVAGEKFDQGLSALGAEIGSLFNGIPTGGEDRPEYDDYAED